MLDQHMIAKPNISFLFKLSEILPANITISTIEVENAGPANTPYSAGVLITDLIL